MFLGRLVPSWWMQKTSSMESQLCMTQRPSGRDFLAPGPHPSTSQGPPLLHHFPSFCLLPSSSSKVQSLISFGFTVKVYNSHWGKRFVAYWLSDPQKVYPRWEQSEIPIVIPRRRSSAFSPLALTGTDSRPSTGIRWLPERVLQPYLEITRTSLVVQWLRLHASNAGGTGFIPGWGSST